jgi:hypothetical protein
MRMDRNGDKANAEQVSTPSPCGYSPCLRGRVAGAVKTKILYAKHNNQTFITLYDYGRPSAQQERI